ncbi:MAG: ABC transporter permease [Desulfobacterales bacterium]
MFFSLKIALASLKAHRLRSILAMVGVFLGALALTAVQHVSQAMYLKAELETAKLGTNLFMARSGKVVFRRSGSAAVRSATTTFTLEDARDLIGSIPQVQAGAPFALKTLPIRYENIKIPCQIVATWPTYTDVRSVNPVLGRFITWEDENRRARVCVLGSKIAERLFGKPEQALGRMVFIFRAGVRVIGVMEPKGADIVGSDQDEQVFVPLSTFLRRFSNQDWITGVYLQLTDNQSYDVVKKTAENILRRRHQLGQGEDDDFSLLTAKDTIQLQEQALQLVQTLGLLSSGISFAVGGLGILSLMVLLVRSRRMEIGVRRAVGARRLDIIRQFILESGLMAGAGGFVGVVSAAGLVLLIYKIGQMPVTYDPIFIIGPMVGSVLLGLIAGAYPAWQAAKIEVLDILRNE